MSIDPSVVYQSNIELSIIFCWNNENKIKITTTTKKHCHTTKVFAILEQFCVLFCLFVFHNIFVKKMKMKTFCLLWVSFLISHFKQYFATKLISFFFNFVPLLKTFRLSFPMKELRKRKEKHNWIKFFPRKTNKHTLEQQIIKKFFFSLIMTKSLIINSIFVVVISFPWICKNILFIYVKIFDALLTWE